MWLVLPLSWMHLVEYSYKEIFRKYCTFSVVQKQQFEQDVECIICMFMFMKPINLTISFQAERF